MSDLERRVTEMCLTDPAFRAHLLSISGAIERAKKFQITKLNSGGPMADDPIPPDASQVASAQRPDLQQMGQMTHCSAIRAASLAQDAESHQKQRQGA